MMEDDKGMATVPGVGKKTAQRLILELKGVFEKDRSLAGSAAPTVPLPFAPAAAEAPSAIEDATAALLSMGFTAAEVTLASMGMMARICASRSSWLWRSGGWEWNRDVGSRRVD